MSYSRKALFITISLSVFLFFYLRQVNQQREDSIAKYFDHPQKGDVYKIRFRNTRGDRGVRYFKVAEMNSNTLFFYRGKLTGWNLNDVLLDSYETESMQSYSRTDLQKMRTGSFRNGEMFNARLVDIAR